MMSSLRQLWKVMFFIALFLKPAMAARNTLSFLEGCKQIYGVAVIRVTDLTANQNATALPLKRIIDALIYADVALVGIMDTPNTCELHDRILQKIRGLELSSIGPIDLRPLSSITNLQELTLNNDAISDITPLGSLSRLASLDLTGNKISDLTPLTKLSHLTQLRLGQNDVHDGDVLAQVPTLRKVLLPNNKITSLTLLITLPQLAWLDLNGNQINEVVGVRFDRSFVLDLSNNPILPEQLRGPTAMLGIEPNSRPDVRVDTPQISASQIIPETPTATACVILPEVRVPRDDLRVRPDIAESFRAEQYLNLWPTCKKPTEEGHLHHPRSH
jgi:hypothetical protein